MRIRYGTGTVLNTILIRILDPNPDLGLCFLEISKKNNIFYSSFLEVSLQISEVSRSSHLICFKFKYNLLQLLPVPVHFNTFYKPLDSDPYYECESGSRRRRNTDPIRIHITR